MYQLAIHYFKCLFCLEAVELLFVPFTSGNIIYNMIVTTCIYTCHKKRSNILGGLLIIQQTKLRNLQELNKFYPTIIEIWILLFKTCLNIYLQCLFCTRSEMSSLPISKTFAANPDILIWKAKRSWKSDSIFLTLNWQLSEFVWVFMYGQDF